MKIIQVVPSITAESAGPSYSVPALCGGLKKNDCDVVLCLAGKPFKHSFAFEICWYPFSRFPHPGLRCSPQMLTSLKKLCKNADIIHNNSLWMMPNIYPDWARRGTKCKLVTQPRGTLSSWALSNSKWRKKIVGWLWQNRTLRNTDMWVATAESEYEDIRVLGYRQPVCILPNGIDMPDSALCNRNAANRRRLYFLSRIHPKKNVEMLIHAWSHLERHFEEWDLSIVGPDLNNRYADAMKALAISLGCQRITFEGELNGNEKIRFVSSSDCLVLPTHSENFGMVVAEALSCGVPVICTQGTPWKGLVEHNCGWWIPTTLTDLERAMHEAMSLSRSKLEAMGARGREWMRRDFSWDGIGAQMKMAYEWLLGRMECPPCVRVE